MDGSISEVENPLVEGENEVITYIPHHQMEPKEKCKLYGWNLIALALSVGFSLLLAYPLYNKDEKHRLETDHLIEKIEHR